MVKRKNVCIIGAGVSGLVAAKTFGARGHKVTILERSGDLGGVWEPARSYPEVQTQSPKDLYRYTDKPMPDSYPEWPKGPQVHAYLTDYARDHGLIEVMRLNTTVVSMVRRNGGLPGWILEIRNRDGGLSREEFDFVAACTGQFNEPQTISHRGADAFRSAGGKLLHSAQHTDPSIVKGKRVVILGGSKSATDIAVNSVNVGAAEVTLIYREPVWRIPYFIGGLVNFKRIVYIRAQEEMFLSWGIGAVSRAARAIAKPLVWANWRALESLLKLQLKLKKCGMVPEERIEDRVNCSVPIATPDFSPMVVDGRIKAVRGTFDHYDGKAIVMTGGERVEADVAILAIGFKLGVPFLPEAYRQARAARRPISALPGDRQPRSSRHGLRRLQLQLLHGAECRNGGKLAGALLRRSIGEPADRGRDAKEYGHDAALQTRRAAGRRRLRRAVYRAIPFQAFRRTAGRHGRDDTPAQPVG
jgi:dimethylaniline monooxygenase (N-oxide forming)